MTRRLQYFVDVFILIASFQLAYMLRFEFAIPATEVQPLLHQLPYVVLLQMTALMLAGIQTFIWRYIGMAELAPFAKAAFGSAMVLLALRLLLPEQYADWRVPLSIIVMDTVLAFGGVIGVRVLRRGVHEYQDRLASGATEEVKKPILLIGAGRAGVAAVREIQDCGRTDLEIRGFVDDDPNKQRSVIHGIRVLGRTSDLPRLVADLQIDHVVISIAEASRRQLKRIHDTCDAIPVKVRIVPALHEILQGTVSFSRIRDVQIEDLLGREPVELDEMDIRTMLTGKTSMITGAGGSIGSELVRQVARFAPARLLLVERAEFALYNVERELRASWPALDIQAIIADIGDAPRMREVLARHRPHVVIHAAAHKHVPMMEHNPGEAVKNNVLATYQLGQLAGEYGVEVFVLISTDKAVRPTSVMGASKRLAELVVQMLNRRYPTRFETVRFGNVIGSAGSVIPLFREQISKGGPVTVTHPEMMRYFMTIPEATQLVLQAAVIGQGGEILVLDMGQPVSILELAKDIITLTGHRPFEDIAIEFTGLRPGEKLYEELERNGENIAKTRHPKIFIGKIAGLEPDQVEGALAELRHLSQDGRDSELRAFLNAFLPDAQIEMPGTMMPAPAPAAPSRSPQRTPLPTGAGGTLAEVLTSQ